MSIDWNSDAQTAVTNALFEVPEVGTVLSTLTSIFWPSSGEDVWGEIKDQVEAVMDQKISDLVYQDVQQSLQGLQGVVNSYLEVVNSGDTEVISERWNAANADFIQQLPSFQASGYEVLLLPLFAQYVNLYQSLLRDGMMEGASWGWNDDVVSSVSNDMTQYTLQFMQWVDTWYGTGYQSMVSKTKSSAHKCEPFKTVNAWVRTMTLGVRDHRWLWGYVSEAAHGLGPFTVYLAREIYSDPKGTCDNSGNIVIPVQPTKFPTEIKVWSGSMVDGAQVSYPSGGGPNHVTTTARMGDQKGGSLNGQFDVSSNPVVEAGGRAGDALNALRFKFQDGTETSWIGGSGGGGFMFSYSGHQLSSIWINGVSDFYGCADCVVYGFKYTPPTTISGTYIEI
jgi:hypothetical protein